MLSHCLALPGAWPDKPWDHEHPVIKVGEGERGKIFAFLGSGSLGIKCGTRDEADEWLAEHPEAAHVMAYIGRSGWNTLDFNSSIEDDELFEAVEESYRLVVGKLPKKLQPEGWDAADRGRPALRQQSPVTPRRPPHPP